LMSYIHSVVYITIQWDGGGALGTEHKSESMYRVCRWPAFD